MKTQRKAYYLISKLHYLALRRIFGLEYSVRRIRFANKETVRFILVKEQATIGKKVNIKGNLIIDNALGDKDATGDFSNLSIGNNCYIGENVFFDLPRKVKICENSIISANASFITHSDCGRRPLSKYYPRKTGDIVVGKNCWVGFGATIMPGVKIGDFSVIAAGSVVTSDLLPNSLYAGSPAIFKKNVIPDEETD